MQLAANLSWMYRELEDAERFAAAAGPHWCEALRERGVLR